MFSVLRSKNRPHLKIIPQMNISTHRHILPCAFLRGLGISVVQPFRSVLVLKNGKVESSADPLPPWLATALHIDDVSNL